MRQILPILITALALSVPAAGHAQPAPAPSPGAVSLEGLAVLDAKGEVLGHVERVITGAGGRPAQVLVRPKGARASGPRSLSFNALRQTDKGLQTPLTRAEFDAMPAVKTPGG